MFSICKTAIAKEGKYNWYVWGNGTTEVLCTNNTMQKIYKAIGKEKEYNIKFWSSKEYAEKGLERYLKSLSEEEFANYIADRLNNRSETT